MWEALNATGKEIVFSLSKNAHISCGYICSKYANMWRTTKDIDDTWESISERFDQGGWEKFAGPGHWNDIDMMVLGYVGWSKQQHSTHLTQDEQITHMNLWCILSSPIILGCDLTRIDDFTMSILTNDEILYLLTVDLAKNLCYNPCRTLPNSQTIKEGIYVTTQQEYALVAERYNLSSLSP